MRKFLSLLTILTIAFSCSSDDSEEQLHQDEFPTNITIPDSQSATVGEILTINGTGFLVNETYIVTFTENQVGTIAEINNDYLKVEIPENAVSGNISLTFNGVTEIIGFLTINAITQLNVYLYRSDFGNNSTTQEITLLNPADGSEQFLVSIPLASTNAFDFIYYEPTNELLGIDQDDDELIKVNLDTNQVSTIQFNNQNIDYHQLKADNSGNIYLYRSDFSNNSTAQEITILNPADGSEQFLMSIPLASTNAFDFIYYEPTNELLGIDQDDDELIKVNLNTNQVSTIQFNNQNIDYHQLTSE